MHTLQKKNRILVILAQIPTNLGFRRFWHHSREMYKGGKAGPQLKVTIVSDGCSISYVTRYSCYKSALIYPQVWLRRLYLFNFKNSLILIFKGIMDFTFNFYDYQAITYLNRKTFQDISTAQKTMRFQYKYFNLQDKVQLTM